MNEKQGQAEMFVLVTKNQLHSLDKNYYILQNKYDFVITIT